MELNLAIEDSEIKYFNDNTKQWILDIKNNIENILLRE